MIVHADADTDYAAERIVWGGTAYAGQTCISVQRVYIHESLEQFQDDLVRRFEKLVVGDPLDEATDVGPVISAAEAERVELWLKEAIADGARILTGGEPSGSLLEATIITGADEQMKVSCEELFAPVIGLYDYSDPRDAIERAGASDFGLQAGIFTNDMRLIDHAWDAIDVGGLNVNDVSTFRIDHMPYGGVKQSGFGREGIRYAIEENTELKQLTYKTCRQFRNALD